MHDRPEGEGRADCAGSETGYGAVEPAGGAETKRLAADEEHDPGIGEREEQQIEEVSRRW